MKIILLVLIKWISFFIIIIILRNKNKEKPKPIDLSPWHLSRHKSRPISIDRYQSSTTKIVLGKVS
jgi:hypothetical protein